MTARYVKRTLEPVIQRAAREFPVVVLTGPRQAGKTTLLKRLFPAPYGYVSLEPPDVREAATRDPRGFVHLYPPPVIYDEVQYAPGLLAYVKEHVDADRQQRGLFLLTGSQNLLMLERVSESLAGRAAILRLLPLSRREEGGEPDAPLPWERAPNASPDFQTSTDRAPWASFLRGGFPELVTDADRDIALWHASYVQTYLERDVRTIRQVGDLTQFQSFLRLVAARSGQLLRLTDLANDLGVAVNTAKAWLSVLEATFQVIILRPYFANVGKRLVKTPKVYFTDVGTLCYLSGLRDPSHAAAGPLGEPILETAVLAEIVKTIAHRGETPQVYFWRTAAGGEVDIVVDTGRALVPIEVKLSATPRAAMAAGISAFRRDLRGKAVPGYVVHLGDVPLPLGADATALPLARLSRPPRFARWSRPRADWRSANAQCGPRQAQHLKARERDDVSAAL